LTIGEDGLAHDCSCPDCFFRQHECKHSKHYNAAFALAIAFAALKARFDVRSPVVIEAKRANYYYYEMLLLSA